MSKSLVRSIKNVASGYSSVQVLVRNATSNDASGPTTYDMEEIANNTYQSQTNFLEIMEMLDRRLNDKGKNWRHVAKSLTVLDYLVRFGSEKCVLWAKDNIYVIKTLREFIHFDDSNNDQGAIIRVKAKELCSLLRDDERLRVERELAQKGRRGRRNRDSENGRSRRNTRSRMDEAYDEDLQRALELSRQTADEESKLRQEDEDDPEFAAALKLSMEEDEMRKQSKNDNLLDLDEDTPYQQQPLQYYMATGYYQVPQQQQYYAQQYDMFGNPIQNPMATGLYQNQYLQQQQQQQQQLLLQQQQLAAAQQQVPQFTGFNYGQPQQQQQEPMVPLKTGSNNPFAMGNPSSVASPQKPTLDSLAEQQTVTQLPQSQPQLVAQNTASRYNDTHELNTLLTQGPGIDTYGNIGATRIPHQHTKTQQFINSSGTGYKQFTGSDQKLTLNTTGNPFTNGNSFAPQQQNPGINPVYTGYGFGNAPQAQQQSQKTDGPSLIDI